MCLSLFIALALWYTILMAANDSEGISHGAALLLFIGTLTVLLGVSQAFLLPQFTQVHIADKAYNAGSIVYYTASLQLEVDALQKRQADSMRPVQSKAYNQYIENKHDIPLVSVWLTDLQQLTDSFTANNTSVIGLQNIVLQYEDGAYQIELAGRVQNVGFNTNTVLAQFSESIEQMPQVASVQSGRFKRIAQGDGRYVSPFTITIILAL